MIRLQKGILKLRLVAKGGYPELGVSAISTLLRVLGDLETASWPSSPELGGTTLNIGLVEGGQAVNALAEHASAVVMFRVTLNPAVILSQVEAVVRDRVDIEVCSLNALVTLGRVYRRIYSDRGTSPTHIVHGNSLLCRT